MTQRLGKNLGARGGVAGAERLVGGSPRVTLAPPAKINLSLVVFPRRPDGYHELHTVMAAIELHDDLYLRPSHTPGVHLRCTGRPAPAGRENLVVRAAELLAEQAGLDPAVEIHLHKRIPVGAGLGGGSSDAAATLLGLNRLWGLGLGREALAPLAGRLGSDVPFFLYAPVAVCTGRGEIVQPLPHRCRRAVLLIVPRLAAPTAQVYAHYRCDPALAQRNVQRVGDFVERGDLDGLVQEGINSLAESCLSLFSALARLRDEIEALGVRPLQVSGSGACLFATADSPARLERWRGQLEGREDLAGVSAERFSEQTEPFVESHHADF